MKLIGIATRPNSKAIMITHESRMITRVAGVDSDARGRPGKRQVTVLSQTQWQLACQDLNIELPWTLRRANLLVDCGRFGPDDIGKQIKIGQLLLIITGETDPCFKMDTQHYGLKQALLPDWRGGVCCKVLADGRVHIGDKVHII